MKRADFLFGENIVSIFLYIERLFDLSIRYTYCNQNVLSRVHDITVDRDEIKKNIEIRFTIKN